MPHLDVDDCVLVVIDAQPGFYGPTRTDVDPDLFEAALTRSSWDSAGQGHANGLTRLRWDGVEMLSAKELSYEWLPDLPTMRDFNAKHPELVDPPGFSL